MRTTPRLIKFLIFLWVLVLILACWFIFHPEEPVITPTPTNTQKPTATFTMTPTKVITDVPTFTPTATFTATSVPTFTPIFTKVPTTTPTVVVVKDYRWWNCVYEMWVDYPRYQWHPCK